MGTPCSGWQRRQYRQACCMHAESFCVFSEGFIFKERVWRPTRIKRSKNKWVKVKIRPNAYLTKILGTGPQTFVKANTDFIVHFEPAGE